MQLRQMDRVGLGGNISLVNQSVSLAFMMLVQVTLFIPIILVGTDMVTDVEVMWSMATPFFFQVDPCLEERYKETSNHDLIRVHCLLGSLIIFIVALVTMFKKPGPIPFLMRSVRTTASMGSRELERNDIPVPLGKKLLFLIS